MDEKRSKEGDELEPPIHRRHVTSRSHLITTSNVGEEVPRVIYGFTPINRPNLGNHTIIHPTPAVDNVDDIFTPSKARKSNLPVRTPVRQQKETANQLWTPPPTKRKESSRAARSKSLVEGDAPLPKRLRRKALEATETSTQDWMTVSKQAQPEVADAKLEEGGELMVSQSTLNKLDSFRYQAKSSEHYQPTSSPDNPGYHLLESNHPATVDPFEDTARFQDQCHMAHFVPTSDPQFDNEKDWDHQKDELLLEDIHINDLKGLPGGQGPTEPSTSLDLPQKVDKKSFPKRTEESKVTSAGKDIFILKNGVYIPVEAMTTMGALHSHLGTGPLLQHGRANISRKLTTTNTPDTNLAISNDDRLFDLDQEDETELAHLTGAVSQDRGATRWHNPTAPPTPPGATPAHLCAAETAQPVSILSIPSSSPQPAPHSTSDRRLEPFVRPPFPKPVDRCPIVDVSSSGVLRTCFRIGEALNAASVASRTGTDVIIELFARVSASTREQAGYKQRIEFADLFHSERPPFLSGTYDLWKDGGRWEEDSRPFLDEHGRGKMCRAVGRLKRDQDTKTWKMAVLNIREASWDDVAWVKGIVCA